MGACILTFGAYSHTDIVRSILASNAISFLPSLIQLFATSKLNDNIQSHVPNKLLRFLFRKFLVNIAPYSKLNKLILLFCSLMAALMQCSAFFVISLKNFSGWSLPIGLILVSFGVLPNYIGNSNNSRSRFLTTCRSIKKHIQKARHKISLFTSLWKAGIVMLVCQLFNPKFNFKLDYFYRSDMKLDYFIPFFIQLAASLVFYLACSLAFKLRMSRLSFALPLLLVTPLSVLLLFVLSNLSSDWIDPFRYSFTYSHKLAWFELPIIYGLVLWWISHLWTTRNIWKNEYNSKETTIKR